MLMAGAMLRASRQRSTISISSGGSIVGPAEAIVFDNALQL
jgi:hypothetical protein